MAATRLLPGNRTGAGVTRGPACEKSITNHKPVTCGYSPHPGSGWASGRSGYDDKATCVNQMRGRSQISRMNRSVSALTVSQPSPKAVMAASWRGVSSCTTKPKKSSMASWP